MVNGDVIKRVRVVLDCNVTYYQRQQGMVNLKLHDIERMTGEATVVKRKRSRVATLDCIHDVTLACFPGTCTLQVEPWKCQPIEANVIYAFDHWGDCRLPLEKSDEVWAREDTTNCFTKRQGRVLDVWQKKYMEVEMGDRKCSILLAQNLFECPWYVRAYGSHCLEDADVFQVLLKG